jgi:hypothetical protein
MPFAPRRACLPEGPNCRRAPRPLPPHCILPWPRPGSQTRLAWHDERLSWPAIRCAAWGKNRENDPCDATNPRIRCTSLGKNRKNAPCDATNRGIRCTGLGKNRENDPCDATNRRIRCTTRGATRRKSAVCAMHATNRRIRCTGLGKNRKNDPCDATNRRIRCTSRGATRRKSAVCAMHATNRRIRCTSQGKNREIGTCRATNAWILCKAASKMAIWQRGMYTIRAGSVEAGLCKSEKKQRRGRDSNPRSGCPDTGFRDRPNRPLWHLSGSHHQPIVEALLTSEKILDGVLVFWKLNW